MSKNIYTPYVYYICWSELDRHYFGCRYAQGCHPKDLWVTYFTSSKHVAEFRKKYGDPDIIEIRETFQTAEETREYEHRVLRKLNVQNNVRWLNRTDNKAFPVLKGEEHHCYGKPKSAETKTKISKSMKGKNKGKSRSQETRDKMSAAKKGMPSNFKGKSHSQETIDKISESKKGKSHSQETIDKISESIKGKNKGKSRSQETRDKMSAVKKGKNNPNYRPDLDENIDKIFSMRNQGYTLKEIAKEMQCHPTTIWRKLRNAT